MDHDPPRPVTDALRLLLETCLHAAEEREEVRRSLVTLNAWLARELDSLGRSGQRRVRAANHGVLTPAGRGRQNGDGEAARDGAPEKRSKRITSRLGTVVTRARWKASACRLSLDKRARAVGEAGESNAEPEGIEQREASLRTRLSTLPDTSTWMLDLPFGRRLSEPDALTVDDDQAQRLARVAECYEALAIGAEIAIQLDEGGAFRRSPPPAFLYLLAEAQSALLQSLSEAPTRSDSDQRDVFLWLKEQTTHYRIYVDRYMRLDDPAEPTGSSDLVERMRRASREILERVKKRRERSHLLSKVRYHVGKLEHQLLASEIESLRQALDEWDRKGHERNDRTLSETLVPLRELVSEGGEPAELLRSLEVLLSAFPARGASPAPPGEMVESPASKDSVGAKPADADAGKAQQTLDEVRSLLSSRRIALMVAKGAEVDEEEMLKALGPASMVLVRLDVDGDEEKRAAAIEELLGGETDLYLLGLRFVPAEYQRFKEACLEKGKQFVRLPGALEPRAIAHQVSRQVGWRLRAQSQPHP